MEQYTIERSTTNTSYLFDIKIELLGSEQVEVMINVRIKDDNDYEGIVLDEVYDIEQYHNGTVKKWIDGSIDETIKEAQEYEY